MKRIRTLSRKEKKDRIENIVAEFRHQLDGLRARRRRLVDLILRRKDEEKIQSLLKAIKK